MKRSYHEFCAIDDPHLHRHRLADDEPAADVGPALSALPFTFSPRSLPVSGFTSAADGVLVAYQALPNTCRGVG
mgnify:CR=1 FL=1